MDRAVTPSHEPVAADAERASRSDANPRAEEPRTPTPRAYPAWRTVANVWAGRDEGTLSPVEVERLRPLDQSTDRNTDAEYAFYRLHGRFLRYAEEYLFPEERILAFVPWTETVTDTWRTRLVRVLAPGARQAREGILLVTGRQILLLRDDVEPVGGTFFAGYAVHATTFERLAAVELRDSPNGHQHVTLALAAGASRERVDWIFPAASAPSLRPTVLLLAGFQPQPGERLPRAPGRILRHRQPPVSANSRRVGRSRRDDGDESLRLAHAEREPGLDNLLSAYRAPDGKRRHVHAAVVVPGEHDGDRLVALTQEHLFVVPRSGAGEPVVRPLSEVTSVELRRSVLGPEVAWVAGEVRLAVRFPPVAMQDCLDVFAVARQALTLLPVEAAGPELPLQDDEDPVAAVSASEGQTLRR
jgi:hypothetical protein